MSDCGDLVTCPNGNCIGCKNGQIWCQDPRCDPYCPGTICKYPGPEHDFNANLMMVVILISLITILIIVWFIYGPQLFESHSDHSRANVLVPEEYLVQQ